MSESAWRCKRCGCGRTYVTHTYPTFGAIRRRRVCEHCGLRFYTTEIVEPVEPVEVQRPAILSYSVPPSVSSDENSSKYIES